MKIDMKIFYDGEIYAAYPKQSGGISRYFDNLISRLPIDFYPTLTTGRSRSGSHPQHQNLRICRYDLKFRPGRINSWLRKQYFQFISNSINAQIAHPTYYSLLTGRDVTNYKCPVVITVYDMIHEIFSESMDSKGQVAEIKRKAIFAADSILCISESTKSDLLDRYPSLEDRITVTPLATELSEALMDQEFKAPSRPYYIYVGARNEYKNFERLLVAFAKVITKLPDLMLCIVGNFFSEKESQRIVELNLDQHIKHCGALADSQLVKLYNASIALVYPSLYEGFGIPLLEAMACGTAVIASNTSSIPEVVGDAGLLFDPKSTDELIDRLLLLAEDSGSRQFLIDKSKQQIKKFSWEKTTKQTVDVYKSLI
jgi:glycosyltransferase involved in cell wall biosynthesis